MHDAVIVDAELTKAAQYASLATQLAAIFDGEPSGLANAANMAAVLYQSLPRLNWAGFYFLMDADLVLGPFQGKVACTRIAPGRGVCGTAAIRRETVVVPDVHAFPGHIACDAASRSEIVIPLIKADRLLGVLDIDSPELERFDADDTRGLTRLVEIYLESSEFGAFLK